MACSNSVHNVLIQRPLIQFCMDKSGMLQNLIHSGRQYYSTGLIITRKITGLIAIQRQYRFLSCNERRYDSVPATNNNADGSLRIDVPSATHYVMTYYRAQAIQHYFIVMNIIFHKGKCTSFIWFCFQKITFHLITFSF